MGCVSVPLRRYGGSVLHEVGHRNSERDLATLVGGVGSGVPGMVFHSAFVANFPNRARRRFGRLTRFTTSVGFRQLNYFTCSPRRSAGTTRVPSRVSRRVGRGHTSVVVRRRRRIVTRCYRDLINGRVRILIRNFSGLTRYFFNEDCTSTPRISNYMFFAYSNRGPGTKSFIGIHMASCANYSPMNRFINGVSWITGELDGFVVFGFRERVG